MAEHSKRQLDPWKMPDIRYKKMFADNNQGDPGNEWTLGEDNFYGDESRLLREDNNSGNESSSAEEDPGTSSTARLKKTNWDKGSNYSLLSNLSERETSSDFEDKTVDHLSGSKTSSILYGEIKTEAHLSEEGETSSIFENKTEVPPSEHGTSSDFGDKTVVPKEQDHSLESYPARARSPLESWSSAHSLISVDEKATASPSQQTHFAVEMDSPLSKTRDATVVKEEQGSWKQSRSSLDSSTRLDTGNVQASTGRSRERVSKELTGNGYIRTSDVVPVILDDDFPGGREKKESVPSTSAGPREGAGRDPLGYDIFARSIAEVVTDERTEMPLTVGVYGEFGMGKTHLLGQVKDEVDAMIEKKKTDYQDYYKGEVDGMKQNRKRKQVTETNTRFPVVRFSGLIVVFLLLLIATVVCAVYNQTGWKALLVCTVLAFVVLVASVNHAYGKSIRRCCGKRISALQRASHMHWMVGVYMDWLEPPVMSETPQAERYEVIWVHFNAWEFSGCKVLWAGIVTTLCDAIEAKIGATPARFYRVIKGQVEGWSGTSKKPLLRCAWFQVLLAVVLGVILSTLVGIFVLEEGTQQLTALISAGSNLLGLGIVVNIKSFFKIAKNLLKSQKDVLKSQMKKPDFAEQLGFMSQVKGEVQTVTSLLRFLEHVTGVQYRVIIVVDDLDCCPGDRVVDVLQAMNILLSDQEANFVSIVAMDPKIVVNCLESHLTETIINNYSGYEYLKRIVHVPVCLPEPNVGNRRDLLREVVRGKPGIITSEYPSATSPGRISFKAGSKARQKLLIDSQGQWTRKCLSALPDAQGDLEVQDGDRKIQDGGRVARKCLSALLEAPSDLEIQDGGREFEDGGREIQDGDHVFQDGDHVFQGADDQANAANRCLKGADSAFEDGVNGDLNMDFLGDVIQVMVQDDDDDDINDIMFYVRGNAHHITDIYHVLGMTVKVLKHKKHLQFVSPRQVASWVVLAEQWPYRLSWVLQFVEDSQQNESIRERSRMMITDLESTRRLSLLGPAVSKNASLFKVFEKVKLEMARVDAKDFARLNNLDADPEMFELLLVESRFTVQDMMTLLPCTINLDWSIQRRIAVARSLAARE
ncbi:PREDICTED: uncharacterized protein LOC109468822 [Branchiostoma belcheri]|uniref:Uncharacterized protein LOC109468822 n=1 Tax=Branchiostoma belcheri TaxID=7741 RepID=A0A6P4YZH6_BRABE|nr:PREDICTED: uncharacterized protein LOC109468822 [Branchiostoma belcheri]